MFVNEKYNSFVILNIFNLVDWFQNAINFVIVRNNSNLFERQFFALSINKNDWVFVIFVQKDINDIWLLFFLFYFF